MSLFRKFRLHKRVSRVAPTPQRQDIPADRAVIGMHVVGLDRPWEEVPVLFQSFVIQDPEQLRILRSHCRWITVERTGYQEVDDAPSPQKGSIPRGAPEDKKPLAEELPNAARQIHRAQSYIDTLLGDVAHNRSFSTLEARQIVRDCVSSIANNANAMFWLTRIRHQDAYTAEHCVRVGLLAITFGRFIGLSETQLELVGLSGMLHDVGKMRIPSHILNKAGALTPQEWAHMQKHAEYGFELLGSEHALEPEIRHAALSHHERLDGKGYPQALNAPAIGKITRMISIVDAYDAMTSDRAYRKGIPTSEALRVLYNYRGQQFDESLVEDFIRMIGIYPPGSLVELNTGDIAVVLASSPLHKLHPIVELIPDPAGATCQSRVLDLSQDPKAPDGATYTILRSLPDGFGGFSLAEHMRRLSAEYEDPLAPTPAPH